MLAIELRASSFCAREMRGTASIADRYLAWVFSVCPHRTTGVREPVMARFGWTADDFRREVTPILDPINPADLSGGLHPANVLFIEGENDTCMPIGAREELWNRLGRPERLTLGANHRNSFLGLTFVDGFQVNRRIGEFLHRGEPAAVGEAPRVTSE